MSIFSGVFDLLFPPRCVFCGKFLKKEEKGICKKCTNELQFTEGSSVSQKGEFFDECVSPFFYGGLVRESILRFKFREATGYASCYAVMLSDCIRQKLGGKYDLITWVPVSGKRLKKRGYDQAMLLALSTALELDDVAVETLRKHTDVPAQSGIEGEEKRRANVSGVYEVTDPQLVNGKKILLIDDIITTGATLSECSRMLLMAGAESVVCATLARSAKQPYDK